MSESENQAGNGGQALPGGVSSGDLPSVEVTTARGRVRGVRRRGVGGLDGERDVNVFRGVPYARPPVGPLRFAAPSPPQAWEGVRDCRAPAVAAPQGSPAPGVPPVWTPADGPDCLTLDVWTPELGAASLPVLVWLYGGVWKYGATRMPHYDAARLAAGGLVVVTVNYRVGFEGFGHVPGAPDNRGLRDQLAALHWVREGVAAFGGDPARVTLAGHSAGAASAALLLGVPDGRALVRRAVLQSLPAGVRTRDEAAAATSLIAAAAGVPMTPDALARLAPQALIAVQDAALRGPQDGMTAFGPVVDGELVTGPAAEAPAAAPEVDLLAGSTREEFRGMGGPLPPGVRLEAVAASVAGASPAGGGASAARTAAGYRAANPGVADDVLAVALLSDVLVRDPTRRAADVHAAAGGRTWCYDLAWGPGPVGAGHGVDVVLLFGDPTTRYAARLLGSPPPPDAEALSLAVRAAWTAFAATGEPGVAGWRPHTAGGDDVHVW